MCRMKYYNIIKHGYYNMSTRGPQSLTRVRISRGSCWGVKANNVIKAEISKPLARVERRMPQINLSIFVTSWVCEIRQDEVEIHAKAVVGVNEGKIR